MARLDVKRYLSRSLPVTRAPPSCPHSQSAPPCASRGGVPRAYESADTGSGGPNGAAGAATEMAASAGDCSGACGSEGGGTAAAACARRRPSRSVGAAPSGARETGERERERRWRRSSRWGEPLVSHMCDCGDANKQMKCR